MPRALIVDDLRTFVFSEEWRAVHARTIVHAVVELEREPVDALYLDHDLGSDKVPHLTTYIAYLHSLGRAPLINEVYLQTSNPVGQQRLRADLEYLGYTVRTGLGDAVLDIVETSLWTETARAIDFANNPY